MSEKTIYDIPYSAESEQGVLGAVMMHNELLERMAFLKPEHFKAEVHQRIFKACVDRFAAGSVANPITLKNQFDIDPDIQTLGKSRYLSQMLSFASTHPIETARYLRELALRRQLIESCEKASAAAADDTADISATCNILAESCEAIAAGDHQFEMLNGEQVAQTICEGMNTFFKPIPTGYSRLDDAMDGGLHKGKMYGFAGKKKHGKTILAGSISCNLAIGGVKHLFICGEMSPYEIHQRNLARMGGFFPSAFTSDYNKSEDFKRKMTNAVSWSQKNILYRNAPGVTFEKLQQILKAAITRYSIKGFILDYLQLVGGKDPRKNTSEHQDEVAQWLADTCRKHGIFGIVMAQINQEGNTRGGEGLRLAADQVYSIQRPDVTASSMWLQMMDTRYTAWNDVGSSARPGFELIGEGPWFREC